PLPSLRPQSPAQEEVKLASLVPQNRAMEAQSESFAPDLGALPREAPVPKARPVRRAAPAQRQISAPLAYAPAETPSDDERGGGLLGRLFQGGQPQLPGRGSGIAVYDIEAATVYLPNGERLEAHSGLAHMQDDPRYVDRKNRGPTPPNVYN